jgi:hypothetical protein
MRGISRKLPPPVTLCPSRKNILLWQKGCRSRKRHKDLKSTAVLKGCLPWVSARFVFFSDGIWRDEKRMPMYSNNFQEELNKGCSLNPPDVNEVTAGGCLHISLKIRYYR